MSQILTNDRISAIRDRLGAANRAFAERNHMEFEIAEVPRDAESGSLNFEPESMRRLFKLGEENAMAGKAWARPD